MVTLFSLPLLQAHRVCPPSAGRCPGEPARQQRGQRAGPARTCALPRGLGGCALLGTGREWKDPAAAQSQHVLPAMPKARARHSLVFSSCLEWWGGNPGAGSAHAPSGGRSGSLMLQPGRKSRAQCVPAQYSV